MKRRSISTSLIALILLGFLLQIIVSSLILYNLSLNQTKKYLTRTVDRVREDIKYQNGKWDTSLYNADGTVPDINPLYIITSDGFVIERWKPIHGFLDIAEFSRLLAYSKPETITTITNEHWRILSEPIVGNNKVIGVITVSAYKPEQSDIDQIDNQLHQTLQEIQSDLVIHGENIDTSKIDARKFPYTITFQVVNHFNKLLIQNDNTTSITRSPTFIDSSYVDNQLDEGQTVIQDSKTRKHFLTLTSPIYDTKHSPVGIIVAASPIDTFYEFNKNYSLVLLLVTSILLIIFLPFIVRLVKQQLLIIRESTATHEIKQFPKRIFFDRKLCKLFIDEVGITIPYASNQYYFCDVLFSKPTKRWEVDQIIERFGDDLRKDSWRKVYDTMLNLNKKVTPFTHQKLFILRNRTYQINPIFIPLLSTSKM